ncbi:MAG: hypothetical protein OM95_13530 [Bdellovibrio sp. ArHS]|uniref:hypothetical protein n=1 Tax=Bdellovibrio sp. ArHS TaxID=1569284 RepID=UPI000582F181|nr:hypothetical protein [Bdellovibrio sp. ArHS]KHD87606.1 MAG: hypothetical protein OM95_13530 [Bdellovibrio sp. ArHS]
MKLKSLLFLAVVALAPQAWSVESVEAFQINDVVYDQATQSAYVVYKINEEHGYLFLKKNADDLEVVPRKPSEISKITSLENQEMEIAKLNSLKPGDVVSFFNRSLKRFDHGKVRSASADGSLTFQVRVFHDGGSYITFDDYRAHISQVGVAVNEKQGFKPGQKVCFQGEKGDLDTVFSNGTGKMVVGDFFGARFLIFERARIVELSRLESCE